MSPKTPRGGASLPDIESVAVFALSRTSGTKVCDQVGGTLYGFDNLDRLPELFKSEDAIIFVCALPIAVRLLAPLIADKHNDPAVVCVDESLRFAIAVLGAHSGANMLAQKLAAGLFVTPVTTTNSDAHALAALDQLPGFVAHGELAPIQRAINDGETVRIEAEIAWPSPLKASSDSNGPTLVISDTVHPRPPATVQLIPPSLVIGVGCSTDCSAQEIEDLISETLDRHHLHPEAVGTFATIHQRRDLVRSVAATYAAEVMSYPSEQLANVMVPNPSGAVLKAVGSTSVAEASAILASGPGGDLIVEKRKSPKATVAIARRSAPMGRLNVVGIGPGSPKHRSALCESTIRNAQVVVGFETYLSYCQDLFVPSQEILSYPIGDEAARVDRAITETTLGKSVALVCSGDAGVYAMASLVFQRIDERRLAELEVRVVPGITAGLAGSAGLGAVLGHDHAYLSLSDLLTPWEVIEMRLWALAPTDMAVLLYNPRSRARTTQLKQAVEIFSEVRGGETKVALAHKISRPGERFSICDLEHFPYEEVDMETLVIVGSSTTKQVGSYLYTPRGYRQ